MDTNYLFNHKLIKNKYMKIIITRNALFSKGWRWHGKYIQLSILTSLLLSISIVSTKACSTFFLKNGSHFVVGRNLDYPYKNYLIFVNKRNVTKTALQYQDELVETPATWTSKYGSVTFNMFGHDVVADGMNETGLVISSLILEQSEYSIIPNKPSVSIDQWIQYMLDNFATVEEVIESCSQINIRYNPGDYWRVHILVTDSNGTNATIEFLNGELVAHTRETLEKKAITNSTYESSIAYYNAGEMTGAPLSSLNRYFKVAEMLDSYNNEDPIDYAYQIMDYVAQTSTQRKIVYDISNRRIYLWSSDNNNIRHFDLSSFNFSCDEPVILYQESPGDIDNISENFIPYTQQINKDFIEQGWQFLNKPYTEEELTAFSLYPESFNCFFINAGKDSTICNSSFGLNANEALFYSGSWSVLSGSGILDQPTLYNTTVRNLSTNENILRWTLSNDFNSFFDDIIITNNETEAYAGTDQLICNDYYQLNANKSLEKANGIWTTVAGSGIFSDLTAYNSMVTELDVGENEFKWTVVKGTCENSDILKLTYNKVTANTNPDSQVCSTESYLEAENPTPNSGLWTLLSGGTYIDNPSTHNSLVENLVFGENIFLWRVEGEGGCYDEDTLIISNNQVLAIAGNNQAICDDNCDINAEDPQTGTGKWSIISGSGIIENTSLHNTSVSELSEGTNLFKWTVINNNCSSHDLVTVLNNSVLAIAGEDQLVTTDSVFLSAYNVNNAVGEWIILEGSGTIENKLNNNTLVFDLSTGINKFAWKITNSNCSDQDEIVVTYDKKTAVNEIVDNNKILEVFPNPANQFLNVKLSLFENEQVQITILNISGKIVYSKINNGILKNIVLKIDINNLQDGLHILNIKADNKIYRRKFIKVSKYH